jgi:transcriptional regulator with XRE-family HTH domain
MVLLRRVIGDALRARRQGQHRTLREVSSAANVSLGYLSEIERGQKEPSSELLAAICDALGARLSELLREVSDTVELAEQVPGVLLPVQDRPVAEPAHPAPAESGAAAAPADGAVRTVAGNGVRRIAADDGKVSVSVRQDSPLKATLRTTRRIRSAPHERDVVCVG